MGLKSMNLFSVLLKKKLCIQEGGCRYDLRFFCFLLLFSFSLFSLSNEISQDGEVPQNIDFLPELEK